MTYHLFHHLPRLFVTGVEDGDDINFMRGLIIGGVISSLTWLGIFMAIYYFS